MPKMSTYIGVVRRHEVVGKFCQKCNCTCTLTNGVDWYHFQLYATYVIIAKTKSSQSIVCGDLQVAACLSRGDGVIYIIIMTTT